MSDGWLQGMHQGSALSLLFAMVMTVKVRQESSWTIMFAEDIVIYSEQGTGGSKQRWRYGLERKGMKVGRKTICV